MTSIDLHNKYFSLISSKISLEHLEGKKYIQTLDEAKNENSQFRRILLTQAQIKELLNE